MMNLSRLPNVTQNMQYVPTPTPSITAPPTNGASPGGIPACANCGTNTTPLWRRDENGSVLCNACGLFLKLHGRPRPISLKTDVIKSRNRVKTSGQGAKRPRTETNGLAASHPDADPAQIVAANQRRASQQAQTNGIDRSISPVSRSGTPGLHNPNIAPQHIFDGVALEGHPMYNNSLPPYQRQPSPSSMSSVNGSHLEPPTSFEALMASNTTLKTRVSELEVINGLFHGRVAELEASEREARHNENVARDAEMRAKQELEEVLAREADLKRRLEELGADVSDISPATKRLRMSDVVDETQTSTPLSTPSQ